MQIRLRSSAIATADNCRRMLWYQYIKRVQCTAVSANLAFGRCVDESAREYLRALTLGLPLTDPVADFRARWDGQLATNEVGFAATQSPQTFERMGVDLMRALPEAWDSTGFEVATDAQGTPLLDVKLSVHLGRHLDIDVYLDGTLDLLAYTDVGDLAYVDVKSASAAHTPLYALRSDQLTSYQVLVEGSPEMELPPLRGLGFWDFLKRQASSRVEKPLLVPLRGPRELSEFREKCFWLAEDIRRDRFPKASRMQFNTPCELCDFAPHCVYGEEEGFVFPAEHAKQTA